MTVKPISASEIRKIKLESIPSEIIEAVNELIQKNFDGNRSTFKQKDLVNLIFEKLPVGAEYMGTKIVRSNLTELHLLDFEDLYRAEGWKVEYDKPGWDENYDSKFNFSLK